MKTKPTILIIEDEDLLLNVISKKLELNGLSPVSCTSGKQALDYLAALNDSNDLPDAIWLDYYLKDMDGLEFMKNIKNNPEYAKLPIIVVSNSANPEKIRNMLDLGASKYFAKAEYRLDDIIKIFFDLVSNKKSSMKKLLIVEDDQLTLDAYRVKLAKAGFEIKTAMDGVEALETLKSYAPDLVLLDLVMPKKDGFTFLKELKCNDKWKNIPAIIASNLSQKSEIAKGVQLGAIDYVVKPDLTLNDLILKIKTILNVS